MNNIDIQAPKLGKKLYMEAYTSNKKKILVEVKVLGEVQRNNFGRKDVVVEPASGIGTIKVDYNKLVIK